MYFENHSEFLKHTFWKREEFCCLHLSEEGVHDKGLVP